MVYRAHASQQHRARRMSDRCDPSHAQAYRGGHPLFILDIFLGLGGWGTKSRLLPGYKKETIEKGSAMGDSF